MILTAYVSYALGVATIIAGLIALAAFAALIIKWKTGFLPTWGSMLAVISLPLATLMSASAVVGSLFYSEIASLAPCVLCWYQRIAMYPMVLVGFIAGVTKKVWSPDMLVLSAIGAIISAYQYLLQVGVLVTSTCDESTFAVSCSDAPFMTFGFITIPMMAFGVFIAVFALQLLGRSHSTESVSPPPQI